MKKIIVLVVSIFLIILIFAFIPVVIIQDFSASMYNKEIMEIVSQIICLNGCNREEIDEYKIATSIYNNVPKYFRKDMVVTYFLESRYDTLAFNGNDYGIGQCNKIHEFDRVKIFTLDYGIEKSFSIFYEWQKIDYDNRFGLYHCGYKTEKNKEHFVWYNNYAKKLLKEVEKIERY